MFLIVCEIPDTEAEAVRLTLIIGKLASDTLQNADYFASDVASEICVAETLLEVDLMLHRVHVLLGWYVLSEKAC